MAGRNSNRDVSLDCRQVKALLGAFLEDGLPPQQKAAMRTRLQGCGDCRRKADQETILASQLRLEAAGQHRRLTPQAASRIQARVYRHVRRGLIMQRTSRVVGGVAGVVVALALVAGALLLWQTLRPGEPAGPMGGETPVPGGPAPRQTAITFAAPDGWLDAYRDLAAEFEALHPGLHVQVVSLEEILGPDLKDSASPEATLRVVSAADTAKWFPTPAELQQGIFRNLTPLMQADAAFQMDDFYPGLLQTFQQGGGTYALPAGGELTLLFFDKDAFDAAGEPYPEAGWSWADFVNKAQRLTRREGDEITRYGYVPALGVSLLESYLADHNAPLQDTSVRPPHPLLASPPVVDAVSWYTDLARRQWVAPALSRQEANSEANRLIREGKAAMWTELASNYGSRSAPVNVGVVPFPSDGGAATTPLVVYDYVMSAGTAQPKAAWRWLRFLSRQAPVGWSSYAVPARRSVAETGGLWARLDGALLDTYRYALEHALVQTPTATDPARQALWQAVDAVLGEDAEVEAALAGAQQTLLSGSAEALPTAEVGVPVVPTPAAPQAGDDRVQITFLAGGGGPEEAYRALAKDFTQSQPDIVVSIRPDPCVSGDACDLAAMAAEGDCFRFGAGVSPDDTGHILDLGPLLDATPGFAQDDYYAVFWSLCQRQGRLSCLPFDGSVGVIRYRKALFDTAGVEYPQAGWTLDDLLTKSVALTRGEGADKRYGFSGYYEEAALHWIVGLRGGGLWDTAADPPRPRFDDPAVVEAVRWYADLARVHEVSPVIHLPIDQDSVGEWWEAHELVETSKVAMWFWYPGGYASPRVTTAAIAPLPQYDGRTLPYVGGFAHYISAQTEQPQACWQWLTFLGDHLEAVQGVPMRRSLAESAAFRRKVGGETADVYLASLEQAGDHVYLVEFQNPWAGWPVRWFDEAYGAVLDGADAAQALGEAQRKATAFVTCIETRHDLEGYELTQACALEVDPEYPVVPYLRQVQDQAEE